MVVGTAQGIQKTWIASRMDAASRWDATAGLSVRGCPWTAERVEVQRPDTSTTQSARRGMGERVTQDMRKDTEGKRKVEEAIKRKDMAEMRRTEWRGRDLARAGSG